MSYHLMFYVYFFLSSPLINIVWEEERNSQTENDEGLAHEKAPALYFIPSSNHHKESAHNETA